MSNIPERLRLFESELITALSSDTSTLDSFPNRFSTLMNDFEEALRLQCLDASSISIAHTLASRIQIIGKHFLKLRSEFETITAGFKDDLDDIFSRPSRSSSPSHSPRLSKTSLSQDSNPSSSSPEKNLAGSPQDPFPAYVAPSYKWLLKNLHDPYPSNQVKSSISHSAGASLKHISAWFVNARRRIGWTTLSRKYFSNHRSETVDAASRALVKEDPKRPLDSNIILEFMTLKAAAEDLYSEKFRKSILVGKLDVVIKDTMADNLVGDGGQESAAILQRGVKGSVTKNSGQTSYPSPDHSSRSSPVPSFTPSLVENVDDFTPPDLVASRKRRASSPLTSSDSDYDILNTPPDRPKKRLCTNKTPSDIFLEHSIMHPMSPQSPPQRIPALSPHLPNLSADTVTTGDLPVNRKRRLSDTDGSYTPKKRPRGLAVGPRLQAVSDPLLLPGEASEMPNFDNWFQINFDMPDAVVTEDFDPSTPLEVEMFNDWVSLGGDTTTQKPISVHQVELPVSELQSLTEGFNITSLPLSADDDQTRRLDGSISLDPFSGSDISSVELLTQSGIDRSTEVDPLTFTPSWEHTNDLFASVDVSELLSQSYSHQPLASSPHGPLHDPWAVFPPPPISTPVFFDDIISQTLPEIDPSQFLSLIPSPADILDPSRRLVTERQAKIDELRKHQEAVRKLEAELAI